MADEALEIWMHLLRGVQFEGSLLDHPCLASVGLEGSSLEARLRDLPGLVFRRQGDLLDYGWRYDGLCDWSAASASVRDHGLAGVSSAADPRTGAGLI